MADQADGLRQLVRSQSRPELEQAECGAGPPAMPGVGFAPQSPIAAGSPPRCRSLVFTSGKGGVGTSNLALNLAVALGELGQRVVLVDADLGLANIDLLCGLTPTHDLGDVLAGDCALAEAIVDGPAGIRIVAGAHASRTLADLLADAPDLLFGELASLEANADFLLIDAGSGLSPAITRLASSSDEVVIVTTPEPTSVADAHAAISRLKRLPTAPLIRAVVNQAASTREGDEVLAHLAAASRQFQGAVVAGLGSVRADPSVPLAVRNRRPVASCYPSSPAARDVRQLAQVLLRGSEPTTRHRKPGFFAVLAARWALARVAAF